MQCSTDRASHTQHLMTLRPPLSNKKMGQSPRKRFNRPRKMCMCQLKKSRGQLVGLVNPSLPLGSQQESWPHTRASATRQGQGHCIDHNALTSIVPVSWVGKKRASREDGNLFFFFFFLISLFYKLECTGGGEVKKKRFF